MPARGKKTQKTRSDTAVQGTNDSSIVSKFAMVQAGYFQDDYLKYMVQKTKARRSPLINRGYYIRAKAMDTLISHFLAQFGNESQIISLGAGFDTTYFRLQSRGSLTPETIYVEIDFHEVATRKARLILANEELWKCVATDEPPVLREHGPEIITSQNYLLLAADLSKLQLLEACWRHLTDSSKPTLLISECVLTYMSPKSSTSVICSAADYFKNAVFLTYEQVYPHRGFGRVMTAHFRRLGSPLKGIVTYPTLSHQQQRYINAGWEVSRSLPMSHFYKTILTLEERERIRRLELFDEYEEWHLKCGHYCVVVSENGLCRGLYRPFQADHSEYCRIISEKTSQVKIQPVLGDFSCLSRFGHTMSALIHSDVTSRTDDVTSRTDDVTSRTDDVTSRTDDVTSRTDDVTSRTDDVTSRTEDVTEHNSEVVVVECQESLVKGKDIKLKLGERDSGKIVFTGGFGDSAGKIVITGGFGDSGGGKHSRELQLSVLDLRDGSCVNLTITGDNLIDRRMFHTAVAVSSKQLLIYGGRTSPANCFHDIIILHMDQTTYTDGQEQEFTGWFEEVVVEGCRPCARYRHASALVKSEESSDFYVAGGRAGNEKVLSDFWLYNVAARQWRELASIPWPCCSARLNPWRNFLVLSGGLDADERPLADISLYHLERNEWKRLDVSGPIQARFSHSAHVIEDDLYLIGGVSLSFPQPALTRINLPSGTAEEYRLPDEETETPLLLHNHTSLEVQVESEENRNMTTSKHFLIVGGGGNCFSFGTHLNPCPVLLSI